MGAIQRVQRQPYAAYPQYLVLSGRRPYDETDALAADICSTIKRRGEDFESDEQLTSWLEEDGVVFTPSFLAVALLDLEHSGTIRRPVVEHSWANEPRPGTYVAPKIYPA